MVVSVVVPTRNRAAMLGDCLDSLLRQSYPADRFEIVVIDDGSSDATAEVVAALGRRPTPQVRYVQQEPRGLNAARNAGFMAAGGDPVCFVDDDVEVPPSWLEALVAGVLRQPAAGCVGGPIRVRFEGAPPRVCGEESWLREGEQDYGSDERPVPHLNGGNLAVRRWVVARVGLFDDSLSGSGDETEWEARVTSAGIAMVYVPSAWLWHRRTAAQMRVPALLRRRFRQGREYARYARRAGQGFSRGRLWLIARTIGPHLCHGIRRRCADGWLEAAWRIGLLWGAVRSRDEARHRHRFLSA